MNDPFSPLQEDIQSSDVMNLLNESASVYVYVRDHAFKICILSFV